MAVPSVRAQGFGVTLLPLQQSGVPVGTHVIWAAIPKNQSGPLPPEYRFDVRSIGGEWRLLRDFSVWASFHWVSLDEGSYDFRVTARDPNTDAQVEANRPFLLTSRLLGSTPAVFPTSHPLVALYSAPPCSLGTVQIRFRKLTGTLWQTTSSKSCQDQKSLNFYIAGMVPDSDYVFQQESLPGSTVVRGPLLGYHTGALPALPFVTVTPVFTSMSAVSLADAIVLHSSPTLPDRDDISFPFATDLQGNMLWYYNRLAPTGRPYSHLTRPIPGGTMLIIASEGFLYQLLREIDLEGNIVRETRVKNISEQLQAMGKEPVVAFTHDAIRLPNGHTLVLGIAERIVTDLQGPGPVNVLGDMVIDLDENLQVTWVWNSFEKLDVSRVAILREVCVSDAPGCPHLYLGSQGNDWTHANSIGYSLVDGNLLISLRNQDWVVKIDYRNGAGTGDVLWRLGKDGDFQFASNDPWPWFSHQHDAEYDGLTLTVYDNGNTRRTFLGATAHSRGQVLLVNQTTMSATLLYNFDLGRYSWALGSAQRLTNGNYSFMCGALNVSGGPGFNFARSVEIVPSGPAQTYRLEVMGSVYRSFRMPNLYLRSVTTEKTNEG